MLAPKTRVFAEFSGLSLLFPLVALKRVFERFIPHVVHIKRVVHTFRYVYAIFTILVS